jgi:thiamine kinase-like enzyme
VQARQLVDRLWPGSGATYEVLGGGITNRNFKVLVGGEAYVLRIGGKDTELLGIDRRAEHAAALAAAESGLGPDVVCFLEPEGCLVTRFVDGSAISPDRAPLAEVAAALRRFHDGRAIPSHFDVFRVVEAYAGTARARGVEPPSGYAEAKRVAAAVERARGVQPAKPCHNDLLNANLIHDGERIRIVDWEYAGMGDVLFDLANFSVNHELDEAGNSELLVAYFGNAGETLLDDLRLMRFMSDFREAMWGVVQQAISDLDFDFAGYAREHFARLERAAGEPAFADALRVRR